jgi:hypothetical protein
MSRIFDIFSPIDTQMELQSKLNLELSLSSTIYQKLLDLFSDLTLILNLTSELELEETE